MGILYEVNRQIAAIQMCHDMKQDRKAHGLPTDLKAVIAGYRKMCPEYADSLERLIYPRLKNNRD